MKRLIAGLLVAVVVLLGVIAYAVTRGDELSYEQLLECAVSADYGLAAPYPDCPDPIS
jgi:hypothetical protein